MKKIGVSLLAVSLVVFFAIPALAEFDPYGSVRVGTFWENTEYNDAADSDDSDFVMSLGDFSNFGAKFNTGDLNGHVQLALEGDENGNAVLLELLYGTWDFGGGTLLVGQDHTPYTLVSDQVAPGQEYDLDNGFIGFGALWDGYQPQIMLEMDFGLYVSLIQPETAESLNLPTPAGLEEDVTFPKICVGYQHETEGLSINVGGAYNTVEAEIAAMNWEEDFDSYLIYVGGTAALGVVDLQWNLHYGQNLGNFGMIGREDAAYAEVNATGDVEDSDCYGGYVQVAFNVDPATIALGGGYTQSENDVLGNEKDEQMSYFVNAKIPLADTFFVVPEFSFYDLMEDAMGNDEPEVWCLGLKWQMDF